MADYRVTWDKKKENELIDYFEAHSCLWDHSHADYFRRDVRDGLMKELSTKLGCDRTGRPYTDRHIKMRWKNIRTTYARECRKSESRAEDGSDYVSKWAFIDRLAFIKDFIKSRAPYNCSNNFRLSAVTTASSDQTDVYQTLSDDDIEEDDDDDLVVCLSEPFKDDSAGQKPNQQDIWDSDDKKNIWISEAVSLANNSSDLKNIDGSKNNLTETWIVQKRVSPHRDWRVEERNSGSPSEMWRKDNRESHPSDVSTDNLHDSNCADTSADIQVGSITYMHNIKNPQSEKNNHGIEDYQQNDGVSLAETLSMNNKVSWSKDKESELIAFFEAHRFLWDHSHPDYFNRDLRDCMIRELSSKLGHDRNGQPYTDGFIRQRWKNLRTTFARELKKIEHHGKHNHETPYISRWAHTERLSFLKDCLKARGHLKVIPHLQNNIDVCHLEMSSGSGFGCSLKGFRRLTNTMYGTVGTGLSMTSRGLRPGFTAMIVSQFGNVQGRLVWSAGMSTAMSTIIVYDSLQRHAVFTVQIGLPNSFVSLSYTHKFQDDDARLRGAIRVGVFSTILECGVEKKITEYSTLGATMLVGVPTGVTLRIKLSRGRQTFLFPIHLSDHLMPSAVFYGTAVPFMMYHAIKVLIIKPYLQEQKKRDIEKKQEENSEIIHKKKMEAEAAIHLMQETVQRVREEENEKSGLLIVKALYGKLSEKSQDGFVDGKYIDVAVPLQCLIRNSSLLIPEKNSKTGILGFYDPCLGEEKSLYIRYKFRNKLHHITLGDCEPLKIPLKKHIIKDNDINGKSFKS